jgi:hypothetical protein
MKEYSLILCEDDSIIKSQIKSNKLTTKSCIIFIGYPNIGEREIRNPEFSLLGLLLNKLY